MFALKCRIGCLCAVMATTFALQGCENSSNGAEQKVEIKAAPKITNDATVYAQKAWDLINQVDPMLYQNQKDQIQKMVREPVRQLTLDWRINVKMTDSVTEGKYALCRKALTSIDSWARAIVEDEGQLELRQSTYEADKAKCKGAISNPELGNTKAYTKIF
ncbi:hypothetical protein G9F31_05675 [Acinetobacter sp. 187]|uniref:Lipoprotein n=1 Tax=Acinetobacter lanii TaxID=2715163 RepID=A0A6G8S3U1_9GAMM|nr:hypothetical protein [Acinetobacter lanii]NHC03256.1 hypothetical protein [Acinetobacter lanii]QIO08643.1 hypothetical protein G8D99_06140 [Acinetobacter lanii]